FVAEAGVTTASRGAAGSPPRATLSGWRFLGGVIDAVSDGVSEKPVATDLVLTLQAVSVRPSDASTTPAATLDSATRYITLTPGNRRSAIVDSIIAQDP